MNISTKTNIFTIFFIFFISALSTTAFSEATKTKESVDVIIKNLEYYRPASGGGVAGNFAFESLKMFTKDLAVTLNNKENIFNSALFIRPNFIGVTADNGSFGFGFPLPEEHFIRDIIQANLVESTILMNEDRIDFSADLFKFAQALTNVHLQNFGLFCKKHPNYRKNDFFAILYGCLNESNFNGKTTKNLSEAIITITSTSPVTNEKLEVNGLIDLLNFKSTEIQLGLASTTLKVSDDYVLKTKSLKLKCSKDEIDVDNFNYQHIINNCLNSVSVDGAIIDLFDNRSKNQFMLDLTKLEVTEDKLLANLKSFQRANPDNAVASTLSVVDLTMACFHEFSDSPTDLPPIINNCLKSSKFRIADLIQSSKSVSRYLNMVINKNNFYLTGKIKPIMFWHDFTLGGDIQYSEANNELTIKVEDADLPIPLFGKSLNLAMFFINMAVGSNEGIRVDKKNRTIYIKLGKGE